MLSPLKHEVETHAEIHHVIFFFFLLWHFISESLHFSDAHYGFTLAF